MKAHKPFQPESRHPHVTKCLVSDVEKTVQREAFPWCFIQCDLEIDFVFSPLGLEQLREVTAKRLSIFLQVKDCVFISDHETTEVSRNQKTEFFGLVFLLFWEIVFSCFSISLQGGQLLSVLIIFLRGNDWSHSLEQDVLLQETEMVIFGQI